MNTTDHRSDRLVLKQRHAENEVQAFADELGWPRMGEQDEDLDIGQSREVMWGAGTALSLHYVEDPISRNDYAMAWGVKESAVVALARMAAERLAVWSPAELFAALDEAADPQARAAAVLRIGLGAPDAFDKSFFDRIITAMADPDTNVREAAIHATLHSPYPQYRDMLRRIAVSDPDPDRRENASIVLESFDDGEDGLR
ncbi:HEAT repeat domain-containing protein [Streptomyces sp. NPDC001920]